MQLILGNLNYSSWSIRAALVARASGLDIPEKIIPLGFPETREQIKSLTGHHTVPVLMEDGLIIRDSLAITEWLAEQAGPGRVWPEDPRNRSLARSACAEMHSGFIALRSQMPVNIRESSPTPPIEGDLKSDIDRIVEIWTRFLSDPKRDGPFLFGDWCAADAFYAPVVTRFRTYGYQLSGDLAAYSDAVWNHELLQRLREQAEAEPWMIEMGHLGPARAWIRD